MEIGTWNGVHASYMIDVAKIHHPINDIEYFGFDLFELLSDELLELEFSKKPPPMREVQLLLEETGANINLFQGNTRELLHKLKERLTDMDFIFIDGGHSIETITSDWNLVKDIMSENTIVVFDDYFTNTEPEIDGIGCNAIIDSLDTKHYEIQTLNPMDCFEKEWGVLKINMVVVVRK